MKLNSINPFDQSINGSVLVSTSDDITQKVTKARNARHLWKNTPIENRIDLLKPLLVLFEKEKQTITTLITQEMGKPILESENEFAFSLNYLKHFFDTTPEYLKSEMIQTEQGSSSIIYEPCGLAACIAPWNFPFSNFIWAVIPNLIVGNTVVFKHSEYCPLMGKFCEEAINILHLPEGVFSEVYGDGQVGNMLLQAPIDFIWFTGSSHTGHALQKIAAEKRIKTILEMGGSNPGIIFEDVDLEKIIPKVCEERFGNAGQICDALKRLIVQESIVEEVKTRITAYIKNVVIDNPLLKNTTLGPLVSQKQLAILESQLADSVVRGAKICVGGNRIKIGDGNYFEPTLISDIDTTMRVWKEEVFGPILPIISFKTEEEAIALANDSIYGLGAFIFSADLTRAKRVAAHIEAGCVDINFGNHWDPAVPFGGRKCSGVGFEHGRLGFQALCQCKVIST